MRKSVEEMNPGHITSAKIVNDRVIKNVSTYARVNLSTGAQYLKRTVDETPENEPAIRGMTATAAEIAYLEQIKGVEKVRKFLAAGLIVVV